MKKLILRACILNVLLCTAVYLLLPLSVFIPLCIATVLSIVTVYLLCFKVGDDLAALFAPNKTITATTVSFLVVTVLMYVSIYNAYKAGVFLEYLGYMLIAAVVGLLIHFAFLRNK